jgi:hypothetical protein
LHGRGAIGDVYHLDKGFGCVARAYFGDEYVGFDFYAIAKLGAGDGWLPRFAGFEWAVLVFGGAFECEVLAAYAGFWHGDFTVAHQSYSPNVHL